MKKPEFRFFNGFITSFTRRIENCSNRVASESAGDNRTLYYYKAVLNPEVELMKYSKKTRVYHNLTSVEIIEDILHEWNIDFRNELSYSRESKNSGNYNMYYALEQCTQFEESDLNFISRLMEREGIFYYFEHNSETGEVGKESIIHRMILRDTMPLESERKAIQLNSLDSWEEAEKIGFQTIMTHEYNFS